MLQSAAIGEFHCVGHAGERILHIFPGANHHHSIRLIRFIRDVGLSIDDVEQLFAVLGVEDRLEEYPSDCISVNGRLALLALLESLEPSIVVFHGIFHTFCWEFLLEHQSWLRRTIWIVWGADLYRDLWAFEAQQKKWITQKVFDTARALWPVSRLFTYMLKRQMWRYGRLAPYYRNLLKFIALRRMRAVCSGLPQECEMIDECYGPGVPLRTLLYPVVGETDTPVPERSASRDERHITVLLGNSCAPTNRHIEAFDWLSRFGVESRLRVLLPLGYGGSEAYREEVIKKGRIIFGDRLLVLDEMLAPDEYCRLLDTVDVVLFNHKRQQGLFNLCYSLTNGCRLFVRSDCPTFDWFRSLGIKVEDSLLLSAMSFGEFALPLTSQEKQINRDVYGRTFSMAACKAGWVEFLRAQIQ